jgi:hypothetical protein
MQPGKTPGIILIVIGGAIGLWVFTRLTSLMGKLYSWSPPFSGYETTTMVAAGVALILIIVGIVKISKKPQA